MRGSLQEQLLKSGIATTDQLKKAKPAPSKNNNQGNKNKKKTNKKRPGQYPQNKQQADAARVAQTAKKAAQNREKLAKPEKEKTLGKELRTEIKKLLKANKQNDKTGEIPYNYVINNQVKRFYITLDQQKSLQNGQMVIVNWNAISYLISKETEVELRKLHPTIEVAGFEEESDVKTGNSENTKNAEDDPYSDYQIPDDLTW